ncbi:hypothetical protein D2Q93_13105 [Alicyclobacillaceae bacterium I2511]|nr:hypothetical protein D2Q93_13105 [Alicyclobacillaceae bacterium I2511]
MNEGYWASLAVFAWVPVWTLLTWRRKSHRSAWLWVTLGSLIQAAMGLIVAVSGTSRLLFSLPDLNIFGPWTFSLDPLAGLLFAVLGWIGAASAILAFAHRRHATAGNSRGMAALVALQYLFTSFLLTAQNALPLLIAWEGMSLCAYGYILVNHHLRRVRRAAYTTLLVSEIGFLLLVLAVVLAAPADGSLSFAAIMVHLHTHPGLAIPVFFLSLFGFGAKAGILPMQLWMPEAYDVTPAHLAAILAGGLLNLGIFGILRVLSWMPPLPVWVGLSVLWLGALGICLGALYGVIEAQIRRVLAFSSIENVGLLGVNLGLVMLFTRLQQPRFAAVAMMTLLVQLISHALAKSLAFVSVGELSRRTGVTSLDELGGLWATLPGVAIALLIASVTLAAVAPFSGFTVEWLTLQGMLQVYRTASTAVMIWVALAAAVTAIGAALTFTVFLRIFVFTMTGRPRKARLTQPKLRPLRPGVRVSLAILAIPSVLLGWFPTFAWAGLDQIVRRLPPQISALKTMVPNVFGNPAANPTPVSLGARLGAFFPVRGLILQPGAFVATIAPSYVLLWFVVFALLGWTLAHSHPRIYGTRSVPAWLGGRAKRVAQSQYTATAYANPYRMLWGGVLHFRVIRHVQRGSSSLPLQLEIQSATVPWLETKMYRVPLLALWPLARLVRHLQHGYLWGYLLTMLLGVVALLLWAGLV